MKGEWSVDNISITPMKVTAELDEKTGLLKMRTHIMGVITEKIVELQSQAIREALLAMGWTPPIDPADKCDGNHDEKTACSDPQCWQFEF